MGFGDTTLMAMVGVALGPGRSLLTIFVGAFFAATVFLLFVYPVGILRARARGETFETPLVPFGVFLAPAAIFTLLFGSSLIGWYLDRVIG
jgi:leader peptidase (prepilin peptidase)/N-methyltransferase